MARSIMVGDSAASQVYVRNKRRSCEQAGIVSSAHDLPATTTESELLELIALLAQQNRLSAGRGKQRLFLGDVQPGGEAAVVPLPHELQAAIDRFARPCAAAAASSEACEASMLRERLPNRSTS